MKRIWLRIIAFLSLGLFLYLFYMSGIVILLMEVVIARLDISDGATTFAVWAALVFSFVSGGILFSVYVASPMVTMISIIEKLSRGNYDLEREENKLYNRKGSLKLSYRLYQEAVANLFALADTLEDARRQREELDIAKQHWLSGVSHDLKTPLSYIMGYSALLLSKDHEWSVEERDKFLSEIHSKGTYIEGLIGDLNLSFQMEYKKGTLPLQKRQVRIADFLQRLLADVMNDPRAYGYEFDFDAPGAEIIVQADEKLLYRTFQNLLMNAVLHNPKGTHIRASVSMAGQTAVIRVADNGVGMDGQALERLFTRYYRRTLRQDANPGGGLGLVVAKEIIEAHGGTAVVTSKLGEGSIFVVELPT